MILSEICYLAFVLGLLVGWILRYYLLTKLEESARYSSGLRRLRLRWPTLFL